MRTGLEAPAKRPRISILVPAWHRPDLTAKCIASLQTQSIGDHYEVIVIENDAESGPIWMGSEPHNVRRLLLPRNYGFAGAINRGLEVCAGEYILLLNNDVQLHRDFLQTLEAHLQAQPQLAFAVGKLLCANDKARLDGAGDAMLLGGGVYRLGHQDLDSGQFEEPREVLAGCGACLLVKRAGLEVAGGLDENFFAYLEDADVSLRLCLAGYSGLYVPTAVAFHLGSATLGSPVHPTIIRWMTRNQIFLLMKNYPLPVLVRLLPRIAIYQLLWFVLSVKRGALIAYLAGLAEAILALPKMLRQQSRIMRVKKISDRDFLDLLRQSEQQIYEWHQQRSPESRAALLKIYFWIFGSPATVTARRQSQT